MNVSILLVILPPEIVDIIARFIKKSNSIDLIKNHINIIINKNESLKRVLQQAINSYDIYCIINRGLIIIDKYFINDLKVILSSNYSREKYNHYFWQCLLNILSRGLMICYKKIIFNNNYHKKKLKNEDNYIYLKKAIKLWFKICIKHNINLLLNINNKKLSSNVIYINSRKIDVKENEFKYNNLLCAPIVTDEIYETFDYLSYDQTVRYITCNDLLKSYLQII